MPHHSHYILHDELIGFDIFKYIDIKFIFDMFDKPPDSINLTSSETRYLYITLIDIILLIAQTEKIDILTFQAYSEELRRVYIRLINKYAESKNLNVYVEEAYFVIQTNI